MNKVFQLIKTAYGTHPQAALTHTHICAGITYGWLIIWSVRCSSTIFCAMFPFPHMTCYISFEMPSMKLYLCSMLFLSFFDIYIYILSGSHCSPASKYPYRWWTPNGSLDTSCVGSSTPHPAAACNAESVSALRREVAAAAGDLGNHCSNGWLGVYQV